MNDVDDIAELLRKATHDIAHQRKLGWIKGVLALVAAFAGAGWSARSYLSQLATKEDISGLERQYAVVQEDARRREEHQDERITTLELKCAEAAQCCIRTGERLDRITTPRAFSRLKD